MTKLGEYVKNMKLAYAEKALLEIKKLAEEELGDWVGIDGTYIPENLQTMKEIFDICEKLDLT